MHDFHADIEHITRVEGHGNIVIDVKGGKIRTLRMDIVESPRFFEAMALGRTYSEVAHITSRICGICAVTHTTTSIKAIESALDFNPSVQTIKLRKLLLNAEFIQSHILHLYFLAAPDFFGTGSVFGMVGDNKEDVLRGMRLKTLANELCALVGGRHIHPITLKIGCFSKNPEPRELSDFKKRIEDSRDEMDETVKFFKNLKIPEFERETEYISLTQPDEYALYDGKIKSSDSGEEIETSDYLDRVREFMVTHSTAKHAKSKRDSYMVGALARFNNNYDQLHPKAKESAMEMGLRHPCYNPYMNNIAQVVETVHCFEESICLIDDLISAGLKDEKREIGPKKGRGVGATEAPRGTLYHEHKLDETGKVTYANYIIPTAQNLANIENDLLSIVPTLLNKQKEEIIVDIEMLVRAYDPCISCATHLMKVEFVNE
ncbi:MAG: Ni/Fe hydrogenase subunit alpha [Candidatus Scalindua sp. AMX11]|nr:MAG: Ni/Fe hydrogenase subunit alpha [Candidatus Scalindua sp.]RZV69949.1 MAG: Ni/Fe hydrogenase subunit alpha [Candidatus Scalindua sp. SCAELEC01]TDE63892.1 MAG: Ni/Fe hydrogenase subunit alpha [Candidatus Scalindua sp. AMX11]GJQ60075.1 MAG: hydrogenase/sulfur reductase subunit alpha [Candidatus Scalindua sp.]